MLRAKMKIDDKNTKFDQDREKIHNFLVSVTME